MPRIVGQTVRATLLAALLLLLSANDSHAQCMSGSRSRPQNGLNGPMFPQSQLMQQLMQQQLLQQMLLQQQLTSMVALRQQPQLPQPFQPPVSGGSNLDQPVAPELSLTTLRGQQRENSRLIATERKQGNSYQSPQSGRLTGFATAVEEQRFADAVQTALDRTQALLALLGQQNAIAYQTAWVKALEKQSATLTQISKRYASDTIR